MVLFRQVRLEFVSCSCCSCSESVGICWAGKCGCFCLFSDFAPPTAVSFCSHSDSLVPLCHFTINVCTCLITSVIFCFPYSRKSTVVVGRAAAVRLGSNGQCGSAFLFIKGLPHLPTRATFTAGLSQLRSPADPHSTAQCDLL